MRFERVPPRAAPSTFPSLDRVFAILLAGGEGRRLLPLTRNCCKPALPFVGGARIVDFAISNCRNSGLNHLGIVTQYKGDTLIRHLNAVWRGNGGMRWYEWAPMAGSTYSGTADAVAQNLSRVPPNFEHVLVLAADHVCRMDYRALLRTHLRAKADLTVACVDVPSAHAHGFGIVGAGLEGRIVRFDEKPANPACLPDRPDRSLASAGVYLFSRATLEERLADKPRDFGYDVLPRAIRGRVFAHRFEDAVEPGCFYWRDIGTLDCYWRTLHEFVGARAPFVLDDPRWPIRHAVGTYTTNDELRTAS